METPGLVTPDIQKDSYIVGRCSLEAYEEIKTTIRDCFDEKEFEPFLMCDLDTGNWNIGLSVSNKKQEPIAAAGSIIESDQMDDLEYFLKKFKEAKTEEEMNKYKRRIALMMDAVVIYRLTRAKQ